MSIRLYVVTAVTVATCTLRLLYTCCKERCLTALLRPTIVPLHTHAHKGSNGEYNIDVDETDDIQVGVLDLSGLSPQEFNDQTKGSNWFVKFYGELPTPPPHTRARAPSLHHVRVRACVHTIRRVEIPTSKHSFYWMEDDGMMTKSPTERKNKRGERTLRNPCFVDGVRGVRSIHERQIACLFPEKLCCSAR